MPRSIVFIASLLLTSGCIVDADLGDSPTDGSGSTGTTGLGTETGTDSTDGPGSSDSTDTGTTGESSAETSSGEPPEFACPPEPFESQCDVVEQDCPNGFRCMPWSEELGVPPAATVCSPIVAEPAARFSPCTVDPSTCTDTCAEGDYCAPTDGSDSGICLGLCGFDGDDANCDEGELCSTCAECSVGTCYQGCDPLMPECPGGAPTCAPSVFDDAFTCLPVPEGMGGVGQQCSDPFQCDPGLACVTEDILDGCDGLGACCTELCDLSDGDPGCTNPAHVCITLFFPGPAFPGQEHVGVCALPEADPCAVPGNCPPPGIDDSVPWCSLANEAACPETALAGFFNGIACEQTCTCELPCMGPEDCPTPLTGTATAECVTDPFGPGSPTSCMYSCEGGQVCPDGMTCSDELGGDAICVWVSPADPDECV